MQQCDVSCTGRSTTWLNSFNQLISVLKQLISQIMCTLDWLEQKPACTWPLWNSHIIMVSEREREKRVHRFPNQTYTLEFGFNCGPPFTLHFHLSGCILCYWVQTLHTNIQAHLETNAHVGTSCCRLWGEDRWEVDWWCLRGRERGM